MKERTFVIFKPDCMEKRLAPDVLARLLKSGLDLVACKMARLDEATLKEHYAHIVDKPYYPPLVAFVDAVAKVRRLLGPTNSREAPSGTIRGDFGDDTRENIAHASDSVENAKIEIARFFKEDELF